MTQIINEQITGVKLTIPYQCVSVDGRTGWIDITAYGWFNLRNVLYGMRKELDEAIVLVEQEYNATS